MKLYTRTETDKQITIVYKYMALHRYAVAILAVVAIIYQIFWRPILLASSLQIKIITLVGVFIILVCFYIFSLGVRKPYKEIMAARKDGKTVKKVSGSVWSLKNPATIVIQK